MSLVYTLPPCLEIHFNKHQHEGFPGVFLFTCYEPFHPCYMPVNLHFMTLTVSGEGKGKAIPLQAWTGPEGSRR
jgi:hypothetical protein